MAINSAQSLDHLPPGNCLDQGRLSTPSFHISPIAGEVGLLEVANTAACRPIFAASSVGEWVNKSCHVMEGETRIVGKGGSSLGWAAMHLAAGPVGA
mmetsp:Transcript_6736/g.18854  ORF Transcript_6736/g.18854 Transcript_6736/m.18854 type:complete len:97 (+) Transcript_6736:254-544(+)